MIRAICIFVFGLSTSFYCNGQNDPGEKKLKQPIHDLPKVDLAEAGMSQDSISKLIQLINTNPPNDFRGMVVLKNNKLVVEEYFNTYWRETIHDIRSAGKSVTSILLGIAIDKGLIKSVEQSIYDFFPKEKYITPIKDEHLNIKIKHLLTMSSGLSANDSDPDSPGNSSKWLTERNWVNFAISLPMAFKPGEKFVYNDVCPMLIGAIIEETSGKTLADFAKENLFSPLGIREFYWYTGANGSTGPMGNLYISTLDFAKIGQLIINKGSWRGKQIVSAQWLSRMGKVEFNLSDQLADGYGYLWYASSYEINHKKYEYIHASGNGGNVLFIVPGENLVVSLTSSAYGQGYGHYRSQNIFRFILKALIQK
jgi:CubicO group peptidase (beta-lactamase class C family)